MRPRSSYVVCYTSRSGSTLLCDALANTGVAGRPEEYFNPDGKAALQQPIWQHDWKANPLPEVVDKILAYGTTPNGVFGCKLWWGWVESLADDLRRLPGNEGLSKEGPSSAVVLAETFPNLRYIWITRRDKLRQAVSFVRARQSDQWIRKVGDQRVPEGKLAFNYHLIDAALRDMVNMEAGWARFFADSGIVPYTVVYEDLVLAYEQTMQGVLDFLQIPLPHNYVWPHPSLEKQADGLSEEWVCRYEEMNRAKQRRRKIAALPVLLRSSALRQNYVKRRLSAGLNSLSTQAKRLLLT